MSKIEKEVFDWNEGIYFEKRICIKSKEDKSAIFTFMTLFAVSQLIMNEAFSLHNITS